MKSIRKSEIKGKIKAPPSKSLTIRAYLSSLLSEGESKIIYPSVCDDAIATLNAIKLLGANVSINNNELLIKSERKIHSNIISCGESGLLIRLLSAICPLFPEKIKLIAEGSLKKRKLGNMENIFKQFNIDIKTDNDYPPVEIKGIYKKRNTVDIDASFGSQILSGLLMALPLFDFDSQINVNNLKSKPYIDLTLDLINKFGIKIENYDYKKFFIKANQKYEPTIYFVEGDWSAVAFFVVAAAINGELEISNVNMNSKQGDKIIVEILERIGGDIFIRNDTIKVSKSELKSFDFDASDYPDLIPALSVLALNCGGQSMIKGVHRLLNKESNRLQALLTEFNVLGASIKLKDDYLIINKSKIKGGECSSHNDHRIAMALSIAGLNSESAVIINDDLCVKKSYPDFFNDLKSIGGNIDE